MLSAPTTYDPGLEREAHEDLVDEARERAIEEYLDGLAGMSARHWTEMTTHFHAPSKPWADDDEFCQRVGELALRAFENWRGI